MKAILIFISIIGYSFGVFGQPTQSNSVMDSMKIDLSKIKNSILSNSRLSNIDANIKEIKDQFVEKDEEGLKGQSIFEDTKGGSAIFLPTGGTIRLNTSDASLKFSFARSISNKSLFFGIDVSGKTNDGLLEIINSGKLSPGARINGVLGYKELFHNSDILDGWIFLKLGYEGASFKIFNSLSSFDKQFEKKTFNTFTTSLGINLKVGGTMLFALSPGYNKVNNYEDLEEIEIIDKKTLKDVSGEITRTYEVKTKARTGDYFVYDQIPVNFDFLWISGDNSRIGIHHYLRFRGERNKSNVGIGSGIHLLKKGNPLASIAGIILELRDLSKINNGFGRNFVIGFSSAYNFKL